MPFEDDPRVQGLYQLPLERFTEARNRLAAELRAGPERDVATALKALPKPSASAWAVNQLYWTERPCFDALRAAADRLRGLQARGVSSEELREAMAERREALRVAVRESEAALTAAGHAATPQVSRRISGNLAALVSGAVQAQPGVLSADLTPPGFEALDGLQPAPRVLSTATPTPTPTMPEPRGQARTPPERASARAATPAPPEASSPQADKRARAESEVQARALVLAAAEAAVLRHRRAVQESSVLLAQASERLTGSESEKREAERRLERASERVEQSRAGVRDAEARSSAAQRELAEAESALARARKPSARDR